MFEQAQRRLHTQNAADRFVHRRRRHLAGAYKLHQILMVETAGHVHVDAGQKRLARRSGTVVGNAVCHEFGNGGPIAINESLETPLLPEDLLQSERICGSGDSVQRIERGHDGGRARIHGRVEWRQIKLPQGMFGEFHRIVISTALRRTVANKMFRARRDTISPIEPRSLVTAYIRSDHRRAKIRVFSRALGHSSPARISRNIYHWGKGPADATSRCLAGGYARHFLDQFRMPRGSQSERNGKLRAKSVNDVKAKQKRNVQPRMLYGDALVSIDLVRGRDVEQCSNLALADHVIIICSPGARSRRLSGRILNQLADFFFERHLFDESVDFLFSAGVTKAGVIDGAT